LRDIYPLNWREWERGREGEGERGRGFDEFLSGIKIHNFNAVQLIPIHYEAALNIK
jgi:hypothetical protein